MSAPQAVAHCSISMGWALGQICPPRLFIGRILGTIVKPLVLRDDQPMRRNSPTSPDLIVADQRDLVRERDGYVLGSIASSRVAQELAQPTLILSLAALHRTSGRF